MKRERAQCGLLVAVALLACAGCAAAPKAGPAAPSPPTSAQAGATTIVAVAPAPAAGPTQTLPEFLGLNCLGQALCKGVNCLRNLIGCRFPGLEAKPALLSLTDPANLSADAPPAVKAAAEIKAAEDAAPQKVKALRYLATIGCAGCYPGVEDAFLAAMDDCTEDVRYEAVNAVRATIGNPCKTCNQSRCCSPKLRKKLEKMAYETNDQGCFKETSPRVRRQARLALCLCGGPPAEGPAAPTTRPLEGPAEEPPAAGAPKQARRDEDDGGGVADREPTIAEALAVLQTAPANAPATARAIGPGTDNTVAATVNGEPILLRDLWPRLHRRQAAGAAGAAPDSARQNAWLREELQAAVDRKLLCQAARRSLSPSELAQAAYRPPSGSDPQNPAAAEGLVAEEALAVEWLQRQIRVSPTTTRQELFTHYRAHLGEFQEPQLLRWEQITARFACYSSPEQAHAAVVYVQNKLLGAPSPAPDGVPLDALESRTVDWTCPNDLPGDVLGRTLAALSVGQVSPVVRDATGVHVVRVLERRHAALRTLDEVADAVHQAVLRERRDAAVMAYVNQLRAEATIWIMPDVPATPAL